jgi:histone deacetylase complex regulatory component SIN3
MMNAMLILQLAKKNVMTIQLLGKGDTTIDDAVTTQEKWQQYVDSYTLVSRPFFLRLI